MPTKQKLNFIDIFSGAGGLSCGLEMSGMKCLLGIDHNKDAIKTFDRNHRYASTYCGDVTKLAKKELLSLTGNYQIHAVVGGPPCQGFSTVGPGDPKDNRNKLFLEFLRIVKTLNPYFIVIENVTGILAKKNEKTLRSIFSKFKSLGYTLNVQVMSSEQYGVPEKRRRTIIIGSRINSEVTFPLSTHNITKNNKFIPPITVGEAFSNLYTKNNLVHNHDVANAQISSKIDLRRIKRIPEGKGIRYEKDEKAYLTPTTKLNINWNEIPESRFRQTKYQRLDRFYPSPTIMTHRHSYYHPTEHRFLTQREAAKIQSFPNHFIFEGSVTSQWRQIGNAVPPLLGKAIGKELYNLLKTSTCKDDLDYTPKINNISKIRGEAFLYTNK